MENIEKVKHEDILSFYQYSIQHDLKIGFILRFSFRLKMPKYENGRSTTLLRWAGLDRDEG